MTDEQFNNLIEAIPNMNRGLPDWANLSLGAIISIIVGFLGTVIQMKLNENFENKKLLKEIKILRTEIKIEIINLGENIAAKYRTNSFLTDQQKSKIKESTNSLKLDIGRLIRLNMILNDKIDDKLMDDQVALVNFDENLKDKNKRENKDTRDMGPYIKDKLFDLNIYKE